MKIASLTDEELYARYARSREPAALELLVARWHQPAYRLARFSCRDGNLAEEAVQDAFLRLSSLRAPFQDRGPGSFRAWFLGLLVNSACAVRRSELRALKKRTLDPRALALCKGGQGQAEPAARELSACLGRSLAGLEDAWRIPLLLHYVEGLQQREVAQALGISQQMVSRRVRQGLDLLKRRLGEAGLTATVAPETLAELGAALRMPANGCARVLAHCAAGSQGPATGSAPDHVPGGSVGRTGAGAPWNRKAPAGRIDSPVWLAICGAVALATGVLVLALPAPGAVKSSPPQSPSARAPVRMPDGTAVQQGPETALAIHRTWDFLSAPPKDLPLLQGEWRWVKGQGMETTSPLSVHALLPLKRVVFPLRAEITFRYRDKSRLSLSVLRTDGTFIYPHTGWSGHCDREDENGIVMVTYLTHRQTLNFNGNSLFSLEEYPADSPATRLCLSFKNALVTRVALDTIPASQIPASEEDLRAFKQNRGPGRFNALYKLQR